MESAAAYLNITNTPSFPKWQMIFLFWKPLPGTLFY